MSSIHPGIPGSLRLATVAACLVALCLPIPPAAHVCVPEKRWVDTLPDRTITASRCLWDPLAGQCLSAVDKRPWTEDTLLQAVLSRASSRANAALVRIDSVKSSHRDSAYSVDGMAYVDRHMSEDVFVTVLEVLRGPAEAGPVIFKERWNMGNVLKGSEYASFLPGKGQSFLALYDPGARMGELVGPATECTGELDGWRILDGRLRKSGENSFPALSIPVEPLRKALPASVRRLAPPGASGRASGHPVTPRDARGRAAAGSARGMYFGDRGAETR